MIEYDTITEAEESVRQALWALAETTIFRDVAIDKQLTQGQDHLWTNIGDNRRNYFSPVQAIQVKLEFNTPMEEALAVLRATEEEVVVKALKDEGQTGADIGNILLITSPWTFAPHISTTDSFWLLNREYSITIIA